jgi:hypothetical protein
MIDNKISIKWIEAILLIVILVVGLGLSTLATSLIEGEREIRRPREEGFIHNTELRLRQSELSTSQAVLSTLRSKMMEQQLELAKHLAKFESLRVFYPALSSTKDLAADTSLKPELKTVLTQLQLDIDSTNRFLKDLDTRLPAAIETEIQKANALNAAQDAVHRDFEQAQGRFQLQTRWITFLASVVLSLAVLVIAGLIVLYLNRRERFGIRAKFVLLSGFAILLALTSYQAFQAAGAVLILVALFATMWGLRSLKEEVAR